MGLTTVAKSGPTAHQQLEMLDSIFGPEYFDQGRLVLTVARDVAGVMKVAHKLQAKVNESFGSMVEVIMEHVKHEWWAKLHETANTVGLHKGQENPDCQVTHIPEGIRKHPYQRDRLPTVEALLLWEDVSGKTRGHCLWSMSYPDVPQLDQVDQIFEELAPYFAKRWAIIELSLAPPVKGEFEDLDGQEAGAHETYVGSGVSVTILACHAHGSALNPSDGVVHVRHCQPLPFKGISDDAGRAKLCFLPAAVNKVQIAETESFHGTEVVLPIEELRSLDMGPTVLPVTLTPKSHAVVTVFVFEMPRVLPPSDESDGVIDWAEQDRVPLAESLVHVIPLKDGEEPVPLIRTGNGVFVAEGGGLPEGFVSLKATCPGFEDEERAVMLLVGVNDFYIPMRKTA